MLFFREMFKYRDLLYFLTKKELKLKYKDSIIGITWSLFNPLIMMVIYTVAFKFILKIEIENYAVFVFTGLLPWLFFQNSVNQSSSSIINNTGLVSKVYFPRSFLPLSIIYSNFVNLLFTMIVLFGALFYFNIPITLHILGLPLILIVLLFLVIGFSLIVTSINTKFRDMSYLMEVIFSAWFYLTPIIYPLSMVPDQFAKYILFNPLTSIIEWMRAIVIYGEDPQTISVIISCSFSLVVFILGILVFKAREKKFVDEL